MLWCYYVVFAADRLPAADERRVSCAVLRIVTCNPIGGHVARGGTCWPRIVAVDTGLAQMNDF